jgi:hypothetical protein
MNTVARFWLLLAAFYTVAHSLLFVLVWHTVDLRLEVIVQHVAIPFLQAMALAWVVGALSLRNFIPAVGQVASRPLSAVLWCAEAALLFVYWGPQLETDLTGMVARTAGLEALLAVVIIVIRLLPTAGFRTGMAIFPFAMLILILGTNGVRPWFNILPLWLPEGWPFLLKQTVVLGSTIVSLILFTGKAQDAFSARNPIAGLILGWSQFFVIVASMALVVNGCLYAFLVSPWQQIIATSLSLAATCILTAALSLPGMRNSGERKTFAYAPIQNPGPLEILRSWIVLALCGVACVIILRLLFFPHWDWPAQTLLSISFIPFMQASWLRWAQALGSGWRSMIGLLKHQFVFIALLCFEITLIGFFAFSKNSGEIPSFPVIVSAWVGFKLAIIGAVMFKGTFQGKARRKFQGVCGAGVLACGIGTAFAGGSSSWAWVLPSLGSASVLLGVWWRPGTFGDTAKLAGATAEALVIPFLAMSFCALITGNQPVGLLMQGVYAMAAVMTTFLAMFLSSLRPAGESRLEIP